MVRTNGTRLTRLLLALAGGLAGAVVATSLWPAEPTSTGARPVLDLQHAAPETSARATQIAAGDAGDAVAAALPGPAAPSRGTSARSCPRDPYPCGGEWPAELVGRDDFVLERVEEVRVPTDDGTLLAGWIAFPKVPPGTKMPTVLSSSPYYDTPLIPTSYYRSPNNPSPPTWAARPTGGRRPLPCPST